MTANILVVDDEPLIRDTLAEYLAQEGFDVTACASGDEALAAAGGRAFDVALCDVQLPGMDGLELLDRLLKSHPQTFVLLITAYATVENAVEAFQRGAHDYLMKPILLDDVLNKIRRLLAYRELFRENQQLRRELSRAWDPDQIVGRSPAMRRVFDMVRKVAPTRSTVLLVGESGTGKELVARALHLQGAGPDARFLAVNCAAIPHDLLENQLFGHRKGAFTGADRDQAGLFVHAQAGTVFLDEIAELPLATQAKLLRAIEQKDILPVGANEPIHVENRVLAATNKDLFREVERGRFREDLFYRLNVVTITIPPLRERREDIPDLVDFLLAKHARTLGKRIPGVTHDTMQLLLACRWKGNVRELDNALQRALILGEGHVITPADLPPDLVPTVGDPVIVDDLSEAVRRFERQHIERILRQVPDKKEAARKLGMGLSSLYRKIAELEISSPVADKAT
ncbi:MAG TPA: sigma-54 dependent transcriptional regulator [Gemmataceae bacterium]|jgi:DNA-binding NtrC family response regulator|nr:sigma-54 dependent transcriptional regulator [Gemmataceae bacterium]